MNAGQGEETESSSSSDEESDPPSPPPKKTKLEKDYMRQQKNRREKKKKKSNKKKSSRRKKAPKREVTSSSESGSSGESSDDIKDDSGKEDETEKDMMKEMMRAVKEGDSNKTNGLTGVMMMKILQQTSGKKGDYSNEEKNEARESTLAREIQSRIDDGAELSGVPSVKDTRDVHKLIEGRILHMLQGKETTIMFAFFSRGTGSKITTQ